MSLKIKLVIVIHEDLFKQDMVIIFKLAIDPLNLHGKNIDTAEEKEINELFVCELRAQYNIEFDNKKNLETKASSIIAISGTVAALLFGFDTFIISRVDPTYHFFMYILALLMISVTSVTASIILSIFVSTIQKYLVVADHRAFYKGQEFDKETWEKYCYSNKNIFNMAIANNYFRCIEHNARINEKKAKYVKFAQILFFCGLAVLPILLAVIFSNNPNIIKN